MSILKTCSKCKQSKPPSEFHKYSRSKDGLRPRCKDCRSTLKKREIKDIPGEEWCDIPGYEGCYEISNKGRVKSLERETIGSDGNRHVTPCRIVGHSTVHGYQTVRLYEEGKWQTSTVHSIVCEVFIGPRPPGYEINHKNGDKSDNRPENLEYVTTQENITHSWEHLEHNPAKGEGHAFSILTNDEVRDMRRLWETGEYTQGELAEIFSTVQTNVSRIVNYRSWKHVK